MSLSPHPEEPDEAGRLEGRGRVRDADVCGMRLRPSFETQHFVLLLRMRFATQAFGRFLRMRFETQDDSQIILIAKVFNFCR